GEGEIPSGSRVSASAGHAVSTAVAEAPGRTAGGATTRTRSVEVGIPGRGRSAALSAGRGDRRGRSRDDAAGGRGAERAGDGRERSSRPVPLLRRGPHVLAERGD